MKPDATFYKFRDKPKTFLEEVLLIESLSFLDTKY